MVETVWFFRILFELLSRLGSGASASSTHPTNVPSLWGSSSPGPPGHYTDANDKLHISVDLIHVVTPELAVPPHGSQSIYQLRLFIKYSCDISF